MVSTTANSGSCRGRKKKRHIFYLKQVLTKRQAVPLGKKHFLEVLEPIKFTFTIRSDEF